MTLDKYTNFLKNRWAVFEKIKKKLNKGRGCKLELSRWLLINKNVKVVWRPHHMFFFLSLDYDIHNNTQHPFSMKLDTNRTNAFANSFILMTSRDWNSLFRPSCRLHITWSQSFKIHRYLQLWPNPWIFFIFSQCK